ncbi:MAG: hypothetical protein K6T90_03055 [Leptolyngbyaceae cyanobacterium HOT.MB2.61]|nr:hypothetical protein [Leptolyngbyaceae cyanobacterium HOT.MB2.61]
MSYPLRDRTLNPTGSSIYQQGTQHYLPSGFHAQLFLILSNFVFETTPPPPQSLPDAERGF